MLWTQAHTSLCIYCMYHVVDYYHCICAGCISSRYLDIPTRRSVWYTPTLVLRQQQLFDPVKLPLLSAVTVCVCLIQLLSFPIHINVYVMIALVFMCTCLCWDHRLKQDTQFR